MSFYIEFVLLQPRDIEFLAAGTAAKLPHNIFLVIPHNPRFK